MESELGINLILNDWFDRCVSNCIQDPESPQNWTSVLNCTADRSSCLQPSDIFTKVVNSVAGMDEDCLFLNVYTPQVHLSLLLSTETAGQRFRDQMHTCVRLSIWLCSNFPRESKDSKIDGLKTFREL